MLWRGFEQRLGVDLGDVAGLAAECFPCLRNFQTCKKSLLHEEFGPKEVHYRQLIGRDIGYALEEEVGMLWRGFGGRLGIDLGDLLRRPNFGRRDQILVF